MMGKVRCVPLSLQRCWRGTPSDALDTTSRLRHNVASTSRSSHANLPVLSSAGCGVVGGDTVAARARTATAKGEGERDAHASIDEWDKAPV